MNTGEVALLAVRMVVSLALVLGLLVLLARYAARRGVGRVTGQRWGIEVLARRQLSRAASVQVVRVADDIYVVGVGDSGVRVLRHLPAAEGVEGSPVGDPHAQDAIGAHRTGGVPDVTGGADQDPSRVRSADVTRLAEQQGGALAGALRMVEDVMRPEGRHRARRGDRHLG